MGMCEVLRNGKPRQSALLIVDIYIYIYAELQRHPHDLEPESSKCSLPGLVTVVTLTEMEN